MIKKKNFLPFVLSFLMIFSDAQISWAISGEDFSDGTFLIILFLIILFLTKSSPMQVSLMISVTILILITYQIYQIFQIFQMIQNQNFFQTQIKLRPFHSPTTADLKTLSSESGFLKTLTRTIMDFFLSRKSKHVPRSIYLLCLSIR